MSRAESRARDSRLPRRGGGALGPHVLQLGSLHSSVFCVMVGLRTGGGRGLDADELVRCSGLRGLSAVGLLRSSTTVGRLFEVCGLGGGMEAALEGAVEVCENFALGPESALLMVPAVWLEYPESLRRSMGTAVSVEPSATGLSAPKSDGWERFAATLAAGERRNDSSTGCSLWSESYSST